jgi:hypothetical protein
VKINISDIRAARLPKRLNNRVITGAPSMTPIAYAETSMPAVGMLTCTPSAMTGSIPMGENSVVPMAKAPMARANKVAEDFMDCGVAVDFTDCSMPG